MLVFHIQICNCSEREGGGGREKVSSDQVSTMRGWVYSKWATDWSHLSLGVTVYEMQEWLRCHEGEEEHHHHLHLPQNTHYRNLHNPCQTLQINRHLFYFSISTRVILLSQYPFSPILLSLHILRLSPFYTYTSFPATPPPFSPPLCRTPRALHTYTSCLCCIILPWWPCWPCLSLSPSHPPSPYTWLDHYKGAWELSPCLYCELRCALCMCSLELVSSVIQPRLTCVHIYLLCFSHE